MNSIRTLMMSAAFSLTVPAQAHDVWLEPKSDALELVYGHVGELHDYDPDKVKVIRAYGGDGGELAVTTATSAGRMTVKPATAAMVTVEYDNGYWTKIDSTTWENQSKRRFDKHLDASHSLKYNKNLLGWNERFKQPTGLALEIVPLENPLAARSGDTLSLQVLYQGKPLPGAGLEVHGIDDSFKTDANGKVAVPLDNQGRLQHIAAYHRYAAPGHLDANEISLTANLVFSTP